MATRPFILVVDDDADLRSLLLELLQSAGFDAAEAANGAAALQLIRGGGPRPDLVLLDLKMPVLNGWEFLAVRDTDPRLLLIPVIVMSGESGFRPEIQRVAFIAKPVKSDRLIPLIASVLEQTNPDPSRLPRSSEPWAMDETSPQLIRNSFGHVVAYVSSEREARRIVAAVNGTSRVSTEALESGIIDKGLECLYQLDRYDRDPEYHREVDSSHGLESLLALRKEVAESLRGSALGAAAKR